MGLDKELENLIGIVSNVNDAYTAALYWLTPDEKYLTLRTFHSLGADTINKESKIELGSGLIGWVAQNGKAVNVSPFKHDPKTLQLYFQEENLKSFMAVPVKIDKKTQGALCVDSKKAYSFTTKMQKILTEFADYFSHIIQEDIENRTMKEQARGYNILYKLHQEMSGITNENILHLIINISRQLFKFDNCIFAALDEEQELTVNVTDNKELRRLPEKFSAEEGIAGLLMRTQKPLLLTDLKARSAPFTVFGEKSLGEIGSFLGIPLYNLNQPMGFLGFTSKDSNAFKESDSQLASILGFQVSSAISLAKAQAFTKNLDKFDALTGLASHSFFHHQLDYFLKGIDRQVPISLLLIDMDDFSRINEKYGFKTGDELLKKVAAIIVKLISEDDVAARFGGKEFILILKDCRRIRAQKIAEKICQVIRQTVFVIGGIEIKATISIGVASYPEDAYSREELLNCVKTAINHAKDKKL